MKKFFKDYLNDKIKVDKLELISIISLIIVISGVTGFIYELIFYYFNYGMTEVYMQGGNFLPWINIYFYGAILILLLTWKFKKNPFLVFIISLLTSAFVEYVGGYLVYTLLDGTRYWDYNTEIWNFGNINGFICLRSVLLFAVGGLFLIYVIYPVCLYLCKHMNKKVFVTISLCLVILFLSDEIYNLVFTKLFNLPSAMEVYKSIGFKYH